VAESTRTKGWQIQESGGTSSGVRKAWTLLLSLALLVGIGIFIWVVFKPVRPLNTHFAQLIVRGYSGKANLTNPRYPGTWLADLDPDEKGLKNWRLHGKLDERSEDVTLTQVVDDLKQKMLVTDASRDQDVLFLYVSAHGFIVGGEPVLLASNFDYDSPESERGYLSAKDFLNNVASLPAKHCVLLLDVSHIESQLRHGVLVNGFLSELENTLRDDVPKNVWVITGNATQQPSHASLLLKRTLFATAIDEAWDRESDKRGDGDQPDRQLTLCEFYESMLQFCFSQSQNALQTPLLMRGQFGLCESKDSVLFADAEELIVAEFTKAPAKSKQKKSGQKDGKKQASKQRRSPWNASHDPLRDLLTSTAPSMLGAATLQPGAQATGAEGEASQGAGSGNSEAAEAETAKTPQAGGTADPNRPVVQPEIAAPIKPTDSLELAWWYRDQLGNRKQSAWSPIDFAPHYWRAVIAKLTQMDHIRRFGGPNKVVDAGITETADYLQRLAVAMESGNEVAGLSSANTSLAVVQTCLAWNHFREASPHRERKRQWEIRKSWSVGQLQKWSATQAAIRQYADAVFELAEWTQFYQTAGRFLEADKQLIEDVNQLLAKLKKYRVSMEQAQYDLDKMTSQLELADDDIQVTKDQLETILQNEINRVTNKAAGTWAWEHECDRLMSCWVLTQPQRQVLRKLSSSVQPKALTLLEIDLAWNEVGNDGTQWEHAKETSKLLIATGGFYAPNQDALELPLPIQGNTWASSHLFSQKYAKWLETLAANAPEPDSMANWRWANGLDPNETANIASKNVRAGFVTSVIAAPNNSGLMLQFSVSSMVRARSMSIRFESVALEEKSIFIDVKSQGSGANIERCQFRMNTARADAMAKALEITVGGQVVRYNETMQIRLAAGALNLRIRPLLDTRQSDENFVVEVVVASSDEAEVKWSAPISFQLEPPPPDHVDLYLSLGDSPKGDDDFARNDVGKLKGIHQTIDRQYLRLTGFPTTARASTYRLWIVDRSGLPRRIRARLYSLPHPNGHTDRNRGAPLQPGRVLEFPSPPQLSELLINEFNARRLASMTPILESIVESQDKNLWGGEYDKPESEFLAKAQRLRFVQPGDGANAEPNAATSATPKTDDQLGWSAHDGALVVLEEIDKDGNTVPDASRDPINGQPAPKRWWKWLGTGARFPAGDYVTVRTRYEPPTRKIVVEVSAKASDFARLGIKKGIAVVAVCRPKSGVKGGYVDPIEQSGDLIRAVPDTEFSWQLTEPPTDGDIHNITLDIDGYKRNIVHVVRAERNRAEDIAGAPFAPDSVDISSLSFVNQQGEPLPPTAAQQQADPTIVLSKEIRNENGVWLPVIYDQLTVRVEVDAPDLFNRLGTKNSERIRVGLWKEGAPVNAPAVTQIEDRFADRRVSTWIDLGNDGLLKVASHVDDHTIRFDKIGTLPNGHLELRVFIEKNGVPDQQPSGIRRLTVDREPPEAGVIRRVQSRENVVYKGETLTVQLDGDDELTDVLETEFRIDGRVGDTAVYNKDSGRAVTAKAIQSNGVWTIAIPEDELKDLPANIDHYLVAQSTDAAGNRQSDHRAYRFRYSPTARKNSTVSIVEFGLRPQVNGKSLGALNPKKNGVSVRIAGEGPTRNDGDTFWFRMQPGKYKAKVTVEFRTGTYVSDPDLEVVAKKSGAIFTTALEKK
jgi:hypothetical protein